MATVVFSSDTRAAMRVGSNEVKNSSIKLNRSMKNPPYTKIIARVVAALVAFAISVSAINAQTQVYSESFETDHGCD